MDVEVGQREMDDTTNNVIKKNSNSNPNNIVEVMINHEPIPIPMSCKFL